MNHKPKLGKEDYKFLDFRIDNWENVQDDLATQAKFRRVSDAMIERARRLTKGNDSDRQMIYSAIYLACAIKYKMDEDTIRAARSSFEEDLSLSVAMDDLIQEEIEKLWRIQ